MIGERLKIARRAAGLSLDALAARVGVSKMAISKYERGLDMPGSSVLLGLARELGVKAEYFFRPTGIRFSTSAFRCRKSLPAKQKSALAARVQEWLERYVEAETIVGQVLTFSFPEHLDRRVDSLEQVEEVAFELRHLVPQNVWDRKEITLKPGETYELAPLTLDPEGRSIEGVLEGADGKPLAGAQVACYLPSQPVNSATADEQGRFKLTRLPVRGYDVWLIAADTAKQLYVMSLVDPDSGEKVRLVLRPLTSASAFLSEPDGQVLADVPVRAFQMLKARQEGATSYSMWNTEWVPISEPVKTAADGAWRISGLVAGGGYALQPETPGTRLDLDKGLFEVDRKGKPTDLGLMMLP